MGSNTSNLNLYKVNPTTDGNDTFNFDTMLNDNWDKIDADKKAQDDALNTHLADYTAHGEIATVDRLNKDVNGIFTELQYKRADGTLFKKSVLNGGTSPEYTIRTVTYYEEDGTTVKSTVIYTLSYDIDGDLIGEVIT